MSSKSKKALPKKLIKPVVVTARSSAKNSNGLTNKEQLFCDYYLIDFNGTQAAIRAGYSTKTAAEIGSQNLRKLHIQAYLQSKKEKRAKTIEIAQNTVVSELGRIAFNDIRGFFDEIGQLIPIQQLSDEAAAAIASLDVEEITLAGVTIGKLKKIKRHDKVRALELLGRHLGIFEKDNAQSAPVITATPFTDSQVEKLLTALKSRK